MPPPPPFGPGGRAHSLAAKGVGGPNSNEGTYTVVLYIYKYFVDGSQKPDFGKEILVRPMSSSATSTKSQSVSCMVRYVDSIQTGGPIQRKRWCETQCRNITFMSTESTPTHTMGSRGRLYPPVRDFGFGLSFKLLFTLKR